MADEVNKILFEVNISKDPEIQKRIKDIASLTKEVDDLKKANKELSKSEGDNSQAMAENEAAIRALNSTLATQKKEVDNIIKQNVSQMGSNNQMRASLALLTNELNAMSAEERATTERGKELVNQTKALSDALKGNEKAVGDNRRNVGNYSEAVEEVSLSLGDMKKQLKELKNTSFAGKTEEEIAAIHEQIGTLTNDMGDLQNKMKAADKGEMLNNFAGSLQAVVSGVQLLSGALSALGVDSEIAKKLEASTMQLISASQALQSIRDINDKGVIKAFATQAKDTYLKVQNTIATYANAQAEAAKATMTGKASMATKAAAAVQWLWNAALAANPILLIVAGLAALTAGTYLLVKALTKVTQAEKDRQLNAEITKKTNEDVKASTGEMITKLEFYRKTANDTTKSEKERKAALEAISKETDGVVRVTDLSSQSLANLNTQMDVYIRAAVAKAKVDSLLKQLAEKQIENENRLNGTLKEEAGIFEKLLNPIADITNNIQAITDGKHKEELITKQLNAAYSEMTNLTVENTKATKANTTAKQNNAKAKDDAAARWKALFEQEKANDKEYADYLNNLQGELNAIIFNQYNIRIGEINAQEQKIQDVIDKSLQSGLIKQEQYDSKKLEITKEYNQQRLDAEAEFALVDLQKITDAELAKHSRNELEKLKITQDYLAKKLAIEQKAGHDTEALQAEIADNEAAIRQKNLDIALLDQTKSLTEQHKLKMDFLQKELDAAKGNDEAELTAKKAMMDEEAAYRNEMIAKYQDYASQTLGIASQLNDMQKTRDDKELEEYNARQEKKKKAVADRLAAGEINEREAAAIQKKLEEDSAKRAAKLQTT